MSQALADGDIHWIPKEDFVKIKWLEVPDDGEKWYFVECDLSVPKELHDKFNDYPLAPEKFRIDYKALSDKQVEIKRHYPTLSNTSAVKLVPNLLPKTKYSLH